MRGSVNEETEGGLGRIFWRVRSWYDFEGGEQVLDLLVFRNIDHVVYFLHDIFFFLNFRRRLDSHCE